MNEEIIVDTNKDTIEVEEDSRAKKVRNFLMITLNGMTMGLFATLIIGTIFEQIGILLGSNGISELILVVAKTLKSSLGMGIGIGVAISLKLDWFKVIVSGSIGLIASSFKIVFGQDQLLLYGNQLGALSVNLDPLTIYLVVIGTILLMKLILVKKTPIDILLIPFLGVILATILTLLLSGPTGFVIYYIAEFVNVSTKAVPFLMVVVISVAMGMILTGPISSAAVAFMISIGTNPLAAAAAIIGTSTQMVGFAVQSRKDNKIGTVLAVGLGTSMLQFKNVVKKPLIWLPTIIASAILAPFVLLFNFDTTAATDVIANAWTLGAGMGTSGLVGQFGSFNALGLSDYRVWLFVLLLQIIGPILLVYIIDLLFRKHGLIKVGDLEV